MRDLVDSQKECYECYKRHCVSGNSFENCRRFREYAKTETGSCMYVDMIRTDRVKWKQGSRDDITMYNIVERLEEEGFEDSGMVAD